MNPKDILEAINQVRLNPNIALNQIKDQLKKLTFQYLDFNQTIYIGIKKILKLELYLKKLDGKIPFQLCKDKNQKDH